MVVALPIPTVRCRPLAECRRYLQKEAKPPRRKKIQKIPVVKRMHRRTTTPQRLLVVKMAIGGATFRQIADRTALRPVTCRSIFESFLARKTVVPGRSTGRQPYPIPDDVHQYLQNSLHDHRFLSLRERCGYLQREMNFPITVSRLRRYFLRNGIKCRRAKTRLKAGLRALTARNVERCDFA